MVTEMRKFGWLFLAVLALGCDDRTTRTRQVLEPYTVVPGAPQVDTGKAEVLTDPARETGRFSVNVPRQCDLYQQAAVRKVDILWVVDSSGSMAPKQARLAANFSGFFNELVNAKPPIDFHIAVASTDTDDPAERGALRGWKLGSRSGSYIACNPTASGGVSCNINPGAVTGPGEAVTAFQQMATVGTGGSAQERGLLAAYLALNNSANVATQVGEEKFVRPDAALYVVMVSDEDDASCNPLTKQGTCTADPGCRCASDGALGAAGAYGSVEYFTRFFETFKGPGRGELVAVAAIVATEGSADAGVPSQFGDPSQHIGCCRTANGQPCPKAGSNDGGFEIAYYGGRYVKVAEGTGGVAVSICDDNFSGALASLGYAASGLRREFRLSRGPDLKGQGGQAAGLELFIAPPNAASCQVDGNCPTAGQVCRSGRCAQRRLVGLGSAIDGAQYVRCDGALLRNAVRFQGTSVPEPLSAVEICYEVQSDFPTSCP